MITAKNFIGVVNANDAKYGHFEDTIKNERAWRMRGFRLRMFDKRAFAVLNFLDDMGYYYMIAEVLGREPFNKEIFADIYVPEYKIAIRISSKSDKFQKKLDKEFYIKFRKDYYPMFIREDETEEFVCEKLEHLIDSIRDAKTNGDEYKKGVSDLRIVFTTPEWAKKNNNKKYNKNGKETIAKTAAATVAEPVAEPAKPKRARIRISSPVKYEKVSYTSSKGKEATSRRSDS